MGCRVSWCRNRRPETTRKATAPLEEALWKQVTERYGTELCAVPERLAMLPGDVALLELRQVAMDLAAGRLDSVGAFQAQIVSDLDGDDDGETVAGLAERPGFEALPARRAMAQRAAAMSASALPRHVVAVEVHIDGLVSSPLRRVCVF